MSENTRILVIDDEIGICEGVQRALTSEGFHVDAAMDGEGGLSMVRGAGYDLVLLDVMMPGVSGIDLIAAIHAIDPEIVCIIITGYATVELAVRAIKQGAYDFLTKPFSVDDLLLAVNQGCERRRLSLDARRTQEAEAEARRLAEEKSRLEELDQAKRKLIRLMTHELQTPVSAILSYLKVIRDGYAPPEKFAEIIEKCIVRAEEERAMIADLLELGRLEIIETRAETELVQLDKVLQDAVDTFQEQAAQKILHFVMDVAPDIPPVVGSPNQFKSLWENLISNAIKYTPKNGTVTLRLHAKDNRVIGEVEDTGIGILPEDRERIFSEFFRARNARESDVYGTGLGLTIVKRIVKNTGGTIDVHSEPGVGSKFTFVIPVANTI